MCWFSLRGGEKEESEEGEGFRDRGGGHRTPPNSLFSLRAGGGIKAACRLYAGLCTHVGCMGQPEGGGVLPPTCSPTAGGSVNV